MVCSFKHLSHGATTVAFQPGCYFKVRMPLFLMLNRFVRAALGWGYGRLRGRPSHPELCFNGLSHHGLIVSLQVAPCHSTCFAMTLCTSVSSLLSCSLSSFSHLLKSPTTSTTTSPSTVFQAVFQKKKKPHCLGPLVLAKLLPHEDSLIVVIQWQGEPWFLKVQRTCVTALVGRQKDRQHLEGMIIMEIRPPASTTTTTTITVLTPQPLPSVLGL